MASAQVVETSVNTNNSPSQDYTTNPDDHSNQNRVINAVTWLVMNESISLAESWNWNIGYPNKTIQLFRTTQM